MDALSGPFLVTGGTGKTGRRVADLLRRRGVEVRAVSRSTDPAFDWTDATSWPAALDGARGVYLVPADGLGVTGEFARRAAEASVERIVVLSARGVTTPGYFENPEPLVSDFLEREQGVRASGVDWTVIRPGWFMQNFDEGEFLDALRGGRLELPTAEGAAAWIDADDIAAVAASLLVDGGHSGETIELTGPRALPVGEATALIAAEAGRAIEYVPVTEDRYREQLREARVAPESIETAVSALSAIWIGSEEPTTDGVRRVLGRDPGTFEDFVRRAAAAWR